MTASASEDGAKEAWRFGSAPLPAETTPGESHVLFGITVASCERGDIRQTPHGITVYRDDGVEEIPVAVDANYSAAALENVYDAIVYGKPVLRDGRWGEATIEVLAAMMESSRTQSEIRLSHQVAGVE